MSSIILSQPGVAHPSAIVGAKTFYWSNAPGFDPLTLSPSFLLDMAQNTDADNTPYATMVDSSGNGRDFTAVSVNTVVKTNVQNGLRVVRFPGGASDSYYRATDGGSILSVSAWFILAVGKNTALTAPGGFPAGNPCIYTNTNATGFGYSNNTPLIGAVIDDGSAEQEANVTTDTTGFHLWMGRQDFGNIIFSQDGGAEDSTACNNSAALGGDSRVGAQYNAAQVWTGDLGALFICNYVPTLAQRTALFNHYKAIWGTP